MAVSIPNVNLDRLIQDQTKFINGIAPASFQSSTVPLTSQFRPTLDTALNTGFRADVSGAQNAARAAGQLQLNDAFDQIRQIQAARGGGGSSAQNAQLGREASRFSTNLADIFAQQALTADENAANRRLGALTPALGEASAANATRGLDLQQAATELGARSQQAGAGQDLISSLLAVADRNDSSSAAAAATGPGHTGGMPTIDPFMRNLQRDLAIQQLRAARLANNAATPKGKSFRVPRDLQFAVDTGLSQTGNEAFARAQRNNSLIRKQDLIDQFGQDGAVQIILGQLAAEAKLFGG